MELKKLTDSLDYVQSLADQPIETSEELKRTFDKAGNKIKEYINNILIESIEDGVSVDLDNLKKDIDKNIKEIISSLKDEVNADISEKINNILKDVDTKFNNYKAEIDKKISDESNIIYSAPVMQNSAKVIWHSLFKKKNIVYIYVEATCNVGAKADEIIFTLPEGFVPSNTQKIRAYLQKEDFNWESSVEIKNGACMINGANSGVNKVIISGIYIV